MIVHRYRIFMPHVAKDVLSPLDLPTLWRTIRADGFLVVERGVMPIGHILEIEEIVEVPGEQATDEKPEPKRSLQ